VNPRIMRPNEVSRIPRLNAAERASISQARLLLRFEGQRLGVIRERSQDSTSATITSCQMLHSAGKLEDLRIPPGNRLEGCVMIGPASIAFESTINSAGALSDGTAMPSM